MAETYITTQNTPSCSVPGDNFDWEMDRTGEAVNSVGITVSAGNTETDYFYTPAGEPGTDGGSGGQDYEVRVDIQTADADMEVSVQLNRVNSSCAVQSSSGFSSEQTADPAGQLTFTFSSLDLGTFASGDILRVDIACRSTAPHGNSSIDIGTGTGRTEVDAPWTISVATKNYYSGGISAAQRLTRGLGWAFGLVRRPAIARKLQRLAAAAAFAVTFLKVLGAL